MTDSQKSTALTGIGIFVHDKIALTVSFSLLAVALVSWIASYYLMPFMMMSSTSDVMMRTGVAAIVSSAPISVPAITLFEIVWIVGMAAMMFPAMIPIILFYNNVFTKFEANPSKARIVGTPLFLGGYLVTYGILGLLAYLSVYVALYATMYVSSGLLSFLAVATPAVILIATGIYQFTPLKFKCLSGCVSPLGFFANKSKKGLVGSLSMGLSHGAYCVGCCVLYMIVMLVVGAMSIAVMSILAGVIALEKVVVKGSIWFGRSVGIGFILAGIVVALFPSLLMSL